MNIGSNPVSGKISFKNSLRARLLVFFLAFSIIPLVVISAISYFQSQNAIIERIKSDLKVQTELQGTMLKTFLRERKDNMIVLAGTARVRTMDPTKVTDAIDQYFKQWGLYENLGLYSPDGNTVYRTDKTSINVFDREYFQTALKGETNIADPLVSKASGNIVYVVAAPVVEGGKIVGVISGSIPTTVFDDYIGANDLGNGDGYLVNNAGFLITASNHTQELIKAGKIINRSELEYQPDTLAVKSILEGKPGVAEYRDSFGETVIGAFSLIEGSTWGLVIENRTSEVLVDVYALRTLYIIAILLAIMIVIGLAIVISNNITRPILQIANMSQMIARGEIPDEEIKVTSKDEIGLLMNSFREIVECFTNIAQVTTSLADGDLTAPVTIHSEKDILGNALNRMEIRLREVIGQMISHADTLDNSSLELATTAQDVDSVTSQISTTIQQIAKGTSLQAESVTRTASNVEELSKTVESVAKGAQEQSSAITNASEVTSQLTVTIEQVTGNAQAVLRDSNNAAEAARKGTGTVQKTLDEMQAIKNSVSQSTLKVQEMGERSGQIGEILTTIEDIASQTNMLALNAAIEAARAGESGKGFAVVADEVRKLAERVSLSTKEIGDLIRGIQTIVSEAMQSMELGTQEVDKGVVLANQAGEALNDILLAADAVNNQAKEAVIATQKMTAAANELVTEVDTVSSVIETNTAATEEMAASAFEVSQAVENIASVSEENSAAVEQVSASTEEMAARVEEVSAAATGLSELAKQMKSMVNRFKVNS